MRALMVATAGGHLTQLLALESRLGVDPANALWVTVPTEQSRSILAGRRVVWARYGSPRDVAALLGHLKLAISTMARERFDAAFSTGASLAPPLLGAARARGIACHYIESATRVQGPSYSGKLVSRIPGVHLYSQYESWATGKWGYGGSVFDGWKVTTAIQQPVIERAIVTVGSARGFPFERMLHAAAAALPAGCEVTWQIGDAQIDGLPGRVVREMSADSLAAEIDASDVVISHAGTGSALTALAAGRCPVIVPRSLEHGEHVDAHQAEIAGMLDERGLAVVRRPEELTAEDLLIAAGLRAESIQAPPFVLAA